MKFKILKDTDFSYDSKDKDVITHTKWYSIKRRVKKNPKAITFNPVEVELQNLYAEWERERQDRFLLRLTLFLCFLAILIVIGHAIWFQS